MCPAQEEGFPHLWNSLIYSFSQKGSFFLSCQVMVWYEGLKTGCYNCKYCKAF